MPRKHLGASLPVAFVLGAACGTPSPAVETDGPLSAPLTHTEEKSPMNGATSPDGQPHPGTITHDDKVEGRTWTEAAADVPQTFAWVSVDERWVPVVRIEATGTREFRRFTKYGPEGAFLETVTPMRPPPVPSAPAPVPVPVPTPE